MYTGWKVCCSSNFVLKSRFSTKYGQIWKLQCFLYSSNGIHYNKEPTFVVYLSHITNKSYKLQCLFKHKIYEVQSKSILEKIKMKYFTLFKNIHRKMPVLIYSSSPAWILNLLGCCGYCQPTFHLSIAFFVIFTPFLTSRRPESEKVY